MASRPNPLPEAEPLQPTLAVTRYDRTSSFLMAVIVLIGLVVVWMGALWVSQVWGASGKAVTVEVIEIPGGDPLGDPGATLRVDGPVRDDVEPSQTEQQSNDLSMEQLANWIDAVAELPIDVDEPQAGEQSGAGSPASGLRGNSDLRSRGAGGAGSGLPREQRWMIYYDPGQTMNEYAEMLDFFNIELGAIIDNRLIYVSRLSDAKPRRRTASPLNDDRLRWTWRGGTRRKADAALLRKAGIDADDAILLQFLPEEVEQQLVELERRAAGGRPSSAIERTAFRVRKVGDRYEFYVVEQSFF